MTNHQLLHGEQSNPLDVNPALQPSGSAAIHEPTDVGPKMPWRRRKHLGIVSLAILLLTAGTPYGVQQWQHYLIHETTDDAYVVGKIIPVSARLGGTVLTVEVEDHQPVEAGQILAQLDPQDFENQVQQAAAAVVMAEANLSRAKMDVEWERQSTHSETARTRATVQEAQSDLQEARHDVEAARARLHTQEAAVSVAQADVESQEALLEMARMGFERLQQLQADGVVARQQFDEAAARLRAARAALRASQRKQAQTQHEVERARIDLRTRQQAISQAAARLDATRAGAAGSQAGQQKVNMKQV